MTTIESLKRNFDDLSKTFVDIGQEAGNLNILKDSSQISWNTHHSVRNTDGSLRKRERQV